MVVRKSVAPEKSTSIRYSNCLRTVPIAFNRNLRNADPSVKGLSKVELMFEGVEYQPLSNCIMGPKLKVKFLSSDSAQKPFLKEIFIGAGFLLVPGTASTPKAGSASTFLTGDSAGFFCSKLSTSSFEEEDGVILKRSLSALESSSFCFSRRSNL